jgi:hypothetical protein
MSFLPSASSVTADKAGAPHNRVRGCQVTCCDLTARALATQECDLGLEVLSGATCSWA